MKNLLIPLLTVIPFMCFGQVTLQIDEVDEFEGTLRKITKPSNCFKSEKTAGILYIGAGRVDDAVFISFTITEDLGCLSEYTGRAMLKLIDDSIVEITQITDTDCDDIASARYVLLKRDEMNDPDFESIMATNLKKLETIPIEKIRVYGSEYYSDYIPNDKFKDFDSKNVLIKHFAALK